MAPGPPSFEHDKAEYIAWAYRLLLSREPESDAAIAQLLHHRTADQLVGVIVNSAEFRARNTISDQRLVDRWVMAPCDPAGTGAFDLWVNLADTAVSWDVIEGTFARAEVEFIGQHVTSGMTVLDLGANIGFFSMLMSGLVGPGGRCVGFEPMPLMHRFATKSARANGFDQCLIHDVALSDRDGAVLLLDNPAAPNSSGAYIATEAAPGHSATTVPTRRLPDLHPGKVDFIKVDVEGAEYLALHPFLPNIAAHRPIVLSEVSPFHLRRVSGVGSHEFVAMFTELGYRCIDLATGAPFAEPAMIGSFTNVAFLP